MNITRSRDSILELFDPLAWPETPPRNTGSPDSSSDKENDNPKPGPVTEFFNRVYKTAECGQLPSGKLIDFGDISISADDDAQAMEVEESEMCEAEEQVENATQSESGDVSDLIVLTPAKQRAPLAEIKLERTPPSGVHLPPTINEDLESSGASDAVESLRAHALTEESSPANAVSAAPYGTPLADVINSINLSAFMPTGPAIQDTENPLDDMVVDAVGSPCPSISICPPEEGLLSSSDAHDAETESPSHLSPTTYARSVAGLRTHGVSTSANDPRRISVDLYSSFSLQMQSADMSFDLLNDKISLFGQTQDQSGSLWAGLPEDDTLEFSKERRTLQDAAETLSHPSHVNIDEDTFDLTKAKMRIDAVAEEYGSIHEESLYVAEAVAAAAVINSPRQASSAALASLPRIFSPPTKTSTPKDTAGASTAAPAALPAPIFSPKLKEQQPEPITNLKPRSSLLPPAGGTKRTSSLRIVRKSWKIDRDSLAPANDPNSESDTRSSCSASTSRFSAETTEDTPASAQSNPKVATRRAQPVKGVQRPPAGAVVPPAPRIRPVTIRPAAASGQRAASIALPAPSSMSRATSIKRPSLANTASSLGRAAASVLQRTAASTYVASSAEKPSGIRAPSRFVASSATAEQTATVLPARSGSSIPKPASKLPATSRTFGFASKPSVYFKKAT